MLKKMFRIKSIGKNFLALLLPVMFIFNWATCESFCAEITGQQYNHTTLSEHQLEDENCVNAGNISEGCKMTANAAVIEARQTVKLSAFSTSSLSTLHHRAPLPAWSALLPEIKQNSPPTAQCASLFIRLCTFRI